MIDLSVLNAEAPLTLEQKDNKLVISKKGDFLRLTNGTAVSIKNMKTLSISADPNSLVITIPDGVRSFVSDGKTFFTDKEDNGNTVEF